MDDLNSEAASCNVANALLGRSYNLAFLKTGVRVSVCGFVSLKHKLAIALVEADVAARGLGDVEAKRGSETERRRLDPSSNLGLNS